MLVVLLFAGVSKIADLVTRFCRDLLFCKVSDGFKGKNFVVAAFFWRIGECQLKNQGYNFRDGF